MRKKFRDVGDGVVFEIKLGYAEAAHLANIADSAHTDIGIIASSIVTDVLTDDAEMHEHQGTEALVHPGTNSVN